MLVTQVRRTNSSSFEVKAILPGKNEEGEWVPFRPLRPLVSTHTIRFWKTSGSDDPDLSRAFLEELVSSCNDYTVTSISNTRLDASNRLIATVSWKPTMETDPKTNREIKVKWADTKNADLLELLLEYPGCMDTEMLQEARLSSLQTKKRKFDHPMKEKINQTFAQEVRALGLEDHDVVYLDAEESITTRHLDENKVNARKIVVNKDPAVIQAAIRWSKGSHGTLYFPGTMEDFLNTARKGSIGAIWLDYCATWEGSASEGISPKRDLDKLFQRELLRTSDTIVAITLCRRGTLRTVDEIIEEILKIGEGRHMGLKHKVLYKSMMFFFFYVL